ANFFLFVASRETGNGIFAAGVPSLRSREKPFPRLLQSHPKGTRCFLPGHPDVVLRAVTKSKSAPERR
ncbi:hypothetical protein, partial [Mesorhizobium sp.]|uniref:hypothetical protein n=1 Tax=Mesorhizobium sp. TaxID=1871066 RepID=UPI0025EAAB6D